MDIDGDIDYTAEKITWRCSAEDVTVLPWRIQSQIEEAECYFHQIIKLMVIKDIREGFEVRWNGLTFFRNEDILVGGFEHFSVSIFYIQDIILPIDINISRWLHHQAAWITRESLGHYRPLWDTRTCRTDDFQKRRYLVSITLW